VLAAAGTRVVGISADERSAALERDIRQILDGVPALLGLPDGTFASAAVEVDDRFVGGGYGVPTPESVEAIELLARTEALFLDPTYTAKAMAGLLARLRGGEFRDDETVLFWHTGGQVGLFA
jgi:1-aminocyclopropane-1-carboxylate deaminase/D-cysteine desulfhydrase-like pyridoxal-dependent ACC family enzyme